MSLASELVRLQEVCTGIERLKAELESFAEKKELFLCKNELSEASGELEKVSEKLRAARQLLKRHEDEAKLLESKIKREEQKLYDGSVKNPKELKSLKEEADALKSRLDEIETSILLEMEEVEDLVADEREKEKTVEALRSKASELQEKVQAKEEKILSSIRDMESEEKEIRSHLAPEVLELFDRLRRDKGGIAVSVLRNGICSACNVSVPFEKLETMTDPNAIYRCDFCRRIIVVGQGT